jgi:hypothetical protein
MQRDGGEARMAERKENPNQERDRSRKPGHPAVDRPAAEHPDARGTDDAEGRDRAPANSITGEKRSPADPWMGGG